jgi:ferritin-like metal-binding protein YciE
MNTDEKSTYSSNNIDETNYGVLLRKSDVKKSAAQYAPLRQLFSEELKTLFWVETALLKFIPKLVKHTSSLDLKEVLALHIRETMIHVIRLEQVFALIGEKPQGARSAAMEVLIKDAFDVVQQCDTGVLCDAGIIAAIRKIEHYEIATYDTLQQFAKTMELKEAYTLLNATLIEEQEADLELAEIAMELINGDDSQKSK